MTVDLIFSGAPTSGAQAHLVFGEGGDVGAPLRTATLTGTFRPLTVLATVGIVTFAAITGTFAPLTVAMAATYESATSRPTVGQASAPWQEGARARAGVEEALREGASTHLAQRVPVRPAEGLRAALAAAWEDGRAVTLAQRGRLANAARLPTAAVDARLQEAMRDRRPTWLAGIQECAALRGGAWASAAQDGLRDRRRWSVESWQDAQARRSSYTGAAARQGLQLVAGRDAEFQNAVRPGPGVQLAPVGPVTDPCYLPPAGGDVHIVLEQLPAGPHLVLLCDRHPALPPGQPALVVVPTRRVYTVFNELELRRVDGNVEIEALSFSLRIDRDSWTFTFAATVPASAQAVLGDLITGEPVPLEASINGVVYRLLAESMGRDRTYPSTRLQVQGRGRAALLHDPYAPVMSFSSAEDRTAQQLMVRVLQIGGVPFGWDVDWELSDWLVPGGTWVHQGSFITALADIAAAAGGYLQPHLTIDTVRVLPRYATPPWEWATDLVPDFELPAAVTTWEGIKWSIKPRYNRVYVSGQHAGVLGQVTRAGTAGDLLAPMVTHPLITHATAATQRGMAVLSDTGPQALVSLRLPVLPETGVILPGAAVRYVDGGKTYLGPVHSTSLQFTRPTLRQTLEVQTHG